MDIRGLLVGSLVISPKAGQRQGWGRSHGSGHDKYCGMLILGIGRPAPGVPSPRKQVTEIGPAQPRPRQAKALDKREGIQRVVQGPRRSGQGNQVQRRREKPRRKPLEYSTGKRRGATDRRRRLSPFEATGHLLEKRVRRATDRHDVGGQNAKRAATVRVAAQPPLDIERLIDPVRPLAQVGPMGMNTAEVATGNNTGVERSRSRSQGPQGKAWKLC